MDHAKNEIHCGICPHCKEAFRTVSCCVCSDPVICCGCQDVLLMDICSLCLEDAEARYHAGIEEEKQEQ